MLDASRSGRASKRQPEGGAQRGGRGAPRPCTYLLQGPGQGRGAKPPGVTGAHSPHDMTSKGPQFRPPGAGGSRQAGRPPGGSGHGTGGAGWPGHLSRVAAERSRSPPPPQTRLAGTLEVPRTGREVCGLVRQEDWRPSPESPGAPGPHTHTGTFRGFLPPLRAQGGPPFSRTALGSPACPASARAPRLQGSSLKPGGQSAKGFPGRSPLPERSPRCPACEGVRGKQTTQEPGDGAVTARLPVIWKSRATRGKVQASSSARGGAAAENRPHWPGWEDTGVQVQELRAAASQGSARAFDFREGHGVTPATPLRWRWGKGTCQEPQRTGAAGLRPPRSAPRGQKRSKSPLYEEATANCV